MHVANAFGDDPHFMPRSVGSGAAMFDYDGDGRLDLYLIQNGGPGSTAVNRLYRQGDDGRFSDVTEGSGAGLADYGMGAAAGDVNNDGKVDLLVTNYLSTRLLLNQSEGATPRFVDVSESAGVVNPLWGSSAAFVDYDRDGWLDLVIANYLDYDPARRCADDSGRREFCGPDAFAGRVTRLFRNLGASAVRFEDVTVAAGLGERPGPGLGVYCADFDGDGWIDIFIANDGRPNHLWINQRNGTFREEAGLRGVAMNGMGKSEADMGVALGDVNGDGLLDLFVTHLDSETHTLWSQGPRGRFKDRTAAVGLAALKWRATGFGTAMLDIDHDGSLDIAIANGRIARAKAIHQQSPRFAPGLDPFWHDYAERDQVLLNDGTGRFDDVSDAHRDFTLEAAVSRGLACGDIDNDGAMDLLVTAIGSRAKLFRNIAPKKGRWLIVRAIDPALNRDAIGAEVRVTAGEKRWIRHVNPGYSYLCSNDPRAHFGLGGVERIDGIEVVWPDGTPQQFPGGPVDRIIELRKGG